MLSLQDLARFEGLAQVLLLKQDVMTLTKKHLKAIERAQAIRPARAFVGERCRNCAHSYALHCAYSPTEPPEACRGLLGTCDCDVFVGSEEETNENR